MMFKLMLLLFLLLQFVSTAYESLGSDTLNSFSSKTAYRNSKLLEFDNDLSHHSSCKLVHINALFRHGTRFPGKKDMRKIKVVHKKILSSDCGRQSLSKEFTDWNMPFSIHRSNQLTAVGLEEMRLLGERFRTRVDTIDGFKDFLSHMQIITSSIERTKLSAAAFIKNFLRNKTVEDKVLAAINENDDKLRFFKNCPYYTKSVLLDQSSQVEFNKFMKGAEVTNAVRNIQKRWNLTDIDLIGDDIRLLYIMCGYEIATNISSNMKPPRCKLSPSNGDLYGCPFEPMFTPVESSPLCSLLEPAHFAIFEYLYDLKHYWTKSYGRGINWKQSCALMSPILKHIQMALEAHQMALKLSAISQKPLRYYLDQYKYNRAVFWFGHAETLLPLVTLLGMFNQTSKMTSTMFAQRLAAIKNPSKRFSQFRVSNISPFSGNVALELYHCSPVSKGDVNGYRIQVTSNEKVVSWPLAGGGSHVSAELFINHLRNCVSGEYDHDKLCAQNL